MTSNSSKVHPDCRGIIASHPASGFGAGITLRTLQTAPGTSFDVLDGDSALSTLLGTFRTDHGVVDWPSGIHFAGSTTAGNLHPHIQVVWELRMALCVGGRCPQYRQQAGPTGEGGRSAGPLAGCSCRSACIPHRTVRMPSSCHWCPTQHTQIFPLYCCAMQVFLFAYEA
jgi:hypothetical protein